jgi:hypothetical protein
MRISTRATRSIVGVLALALALHALTGRSTRPGVRRAECGGVHRSTAATTRRKASASSTRATGRTPNVSRRFVHGMPPCKSGLG